MEHGNGNGNGNGHQHHITMFRRKFIVSTVLTVPVLALSDTIQSWFGFTIDFPGRVYALLGFSIIIFIYGGLPFLQGLVSELKDRAPGMMTLIGMAILVSFTYSAATVFFPLGKGFFWELATLIDVMLLGHWIEAKSVAGASRALEELMKIMPDTAHRKTQDGSLEDVPVSELNKGDIVVVRPGEKIPTDGTVEDGESAVNESMLTGESKPVAKEKGDEVIGGAVTEDGSLTVKVEKTGEETFLASVVSMVEKAQESRSKTQNLADRAAALLFYYATGAGLVTAAVWLFIADPQTALTRTVTVLVIACPHALGLAIPLVVALSTAMTAKQGLLIRDRNAFERSRLLDTIVFDKTGTLTTGEFQVEETVALIDEETLIRTAASVEQHSEHIIARAVAAHAKQQDIRAGEAKNFSAIPGKGAKAEVDGKTVHVVSPRWLKENDISIDDERITKLNEKGRTMAYVVIDGEAAGAFALADTVREEAKEAVSMLQDAGRTVVLLTGDNENVAREVAEELGIEKYFAEVLPDGKADVIEKLMKEGHSTAMVGDGINDAPALAVADVGIAIGAGTDVAMESAGIVLVKNDPRDVARLIEAADTTYGKMRQNLWWASGYNIIAVPLAAGILAPIGVFINPAVGALFMSASTVIVAANTQTLRKTLTPG